MEFKTYGVEAKVEVNGDVTINQNLTGDDSGVTLTRQEADMLQRWLQEILKVQHES